MGVRRKYGDGGGGTRVSAMGLAAATCIVCRELVYVWINRRMD
jgi:hypothetical protein